MPVRFRYDPITGVVKINNRDGYRYSSVALVTLFSHYLLTYFNLIHFVQLTITFDAFFSTYSN